MTKIKRKNQLSKQQILNKSLKNPETRHEMSSIKSNTEPQQSYRLPSRIRKVEPIQRASAKQIDQNLKNEIKKYKKNPIVKAVENAKRQFKNRIQSSPKRLSPSERQKIAERVTAQNLRNLSIDICERRKSRRETLFANVFRKGGRGAKRHNKTFLNKKYSKMRC